MYADAESTFIKYVNKNRFYVVEDSVYSDVDMESQCVYAAGS